MTTNKVLVFKIKDMQNKRHLFKIDMNAQPPSHV